MKKLLIALSLGLLAFTTVHAQHTTVVIQRPGILTELATTAGTIVALPFAVVEGIVIGTTEAVSEMIHESTEVIVMPPAKPVPAPIAIPPAPVVVMPPAAVKTAPTIAPTTTITTRYDDGSVVQVTRQASAYELGPGPVIVPVDPAHRVGSSPHANPYVFRYR